MLDKVAEPTNLIELHKQLNEFTARHHNKGGQEAHRLIKALWDESRKVIRDGSELGLATDEGFDNAIEFVLSELHNRFVP